jgi:hypothetical protein
MLGERFLRRFSSRLLEPAMNSVLVVALVAACMVNMACLFGHL